jgi:biopolymer transport protein ExbB
MNKKMIKLMFAFSIAAVAVALGQDAVAAVADTGATVQKTTLMAMIKQGGPFMWPLGLFSMGMIYFIVQNFLALREKVLLRPDMMPEFIQLMKDKKVLEAHTLCKENETLFTYVFAAGLERCSTRGDINFGKVKEAIEEASTEEVTQYMKPIDYLSIIGATAPMLGLLGTVSGMIKAFQSIGASGMGKPEKLAGNIGEALVTTATGLIIAIPAMLFYYFFRNNFIKSTATLGRNIGALLDTLESGELPLGFVDASAGSSAKKAPADSAE